MKRLNVLYFAHVRSRLGRASETLEVADDATVADVVALLVSRYPGLAALMPTTRTALDGEFVGPEVPVADGSEFVLIPPVAGGLGDRELRVALTDGLLDDDNLRGLMASVSDDAHGAVVTFTGVVRNHARGRAVTRLEYEAYPSMALRKLREIAAEVETDFPGTRVAVHHRTGVLDIGDVAVQIAVGSAHRREGFDACSRLIDRLKEDVPIWKREVGPDGEEWVSDRP